MLQDPFPDREPDGTELDSPAPPPPGGDGPESGNGWPEDEGQGPEQGLFVCLPAEEVSLAGFGQDGRADTMAPGPLLASIVDAVLGEDGAGLAGLGDDQLIGILSAARRMESRAAWTVLAALGELARRRPAGTEPGIPAGAGSAISLPTRWPPSCTQPHPAAHRPSSQRAVHRAWLWPARRPLRPGSHHRLGAGWLDVRV